MSDTRLLIIDGIYFIMDGWWFDCRNNKYQILNQK